MVYMFKSSKKYAVELLVKGDKLREMKEVVIVDEWPYTKGKVLRPTTFGQKMSTNDKNLCLVYFVTTF